MHRRDALEDGLPPASVCLRDKKVLVIGAGGLGCPALEMLVHAGVGAITVVDDDRVDESNLHRQTLFDEEDIGQSKGYVAKKKLEALARSLGRPLDVVAHEARCVPENAERLVQAHDWVFEGADNFATKFLVSDTCQKLKIPSVQAGVVRWAGWAHISVPQPLPRIPRPNPLSRSQVADGEQAGGQSVEGERQGVQGDLVQGDLVQGDLVQGDLVQRARTQREGTPTSAKQLTGGDANPGHTQALPAERGSCLRCIFEDIPQGMPETCAEAGVLGPVVGAVAALAMDMMFRAWSGDLALAGSLARYDAKAGKARCTRMLARPDCSSCGRSSGVATV